eukprot:TRINITY_DN5668_c0_g1_i1.p1 TRINITY_DN5668_c0_g1~~TRINITY_DN5668_c0_g1_i1.p1  ORF type:complete len:173 (+),score=19.48 TRINITY_DN5668_c0_g1_i1:171-689(+)
MTTRSIKCVVEGDGGIGKTSMITTYVTNVFPTEYVPTFLDSRSVNVMFDGVMVELNICDTAGGEGFDHLRPVVFYPGTDVFFLAFSVVAPYSFQNLTDRYHPFVSRHCPNIPYIVVATKVDLREDRNIIDQLQQQNMSPISKERGEELAKELKAVKYMEWIVNRTGFERALL